MNSVSGEVNSLDLDIHGGYKNSSQFCADLNWRMKSSLGKSDMWANRMLLREKWPHFVGRERTSKPSAGLLLYRHLEGNLLVFLVHPGGPYFRDHDLGTWTIPKGEIKPGESLLNAACLRFAEEFGVPAFGPFTPLPPAEERSGNVVHAWACEGDSDSTILVSKSSELTSHLSSGENQPFPARAQWFEYKSAKFRIDPAQANWLDELAAHVWPRMSSRSS